MKNLLLKSLTALTMSAALSLPAQSGQMGYFNHQYQGLNPGRSTVKDMHNKLGEPLKIEKTSNGKNYIYQKVIVNFSSEPKHQINTITIYNDAKYRDKNGIKLGDSVQKVTRKLGIKNQADYLVDNNNGIIYWHDGTHISKIVLPFSFYIR